MYNECMIKLSDKYREIVDTFIKEHWGSRDIIINNECIIPSKHQGFLVFNSIELIGLITFRHKGSICEILTLNSIIENQGIGNALINQLIEYCREKHWKILELMTTNDNTQALRFYQKHGFIIRDIRLNQIKQSRKLKPGIPLNGNNSIPIRDEIILQLSILP